MTISSWLTFSYTEESQTSRWLSENPKLTSESQSTNGLIYSSKLETHLHLKEDETRALVDFIWARTYKVKKQGRIVLYQLSRKDFQIY